MHRSRGCPEDHDSPLVFGGVMNFGKSADVAASLLLMGLILPRGKRSEEHYGGWDQVIV